MINFFLSGGIGMFVILALGLSSLAQAIRLVQRPVEGRVGALRAFTSATAWATLAGFAAALSAVFTKVPKNEEWVKSADLPLIVMTGLGESMAPLLLGSALLALTWMFAGIAFRRMAL